MRNLAWSLTAISAVLIQGPLLVTTLGTENRRRVDFFQDWSSAREVLDGRSAYPDLSGAAARLLGETKVSDSLAPRINPHPPVSVLLCLPLAALDYGKALWVWRLATVAVVIASIISLAVGLRLSPAPAVATAQLLVLATA